MVVVIKHNSTMTQLDLSLNNLDTDDCNTLVEAIAGAALAEAIKHNSTVTQLDLSVTTFILITVIHWQKQSNTIER